MAGQDRVKAYKAWPTWAQVAAPVAAVVVVAGAIGSVGGADSPARETTSTTVVEFVEISEATELAMGAAEDAGLTESQTRSLVEATCKAAEESDGSDGLAERIAELDVEESALRPLLAGLGDAAEAYCPDAVSASPGLINDTYGAGVILVRAATTTTTAAPTTTVAPTTTAPPTTTTAPPPPPTTTTAPPSSDVYYANCDAARAAGAAPLYRGDPGYRAGLDRDDDGVACE